MQSVLLCNTLQKLTCTWIKVQTTNKQKFHMSCHIVIPDFEAHHQEIEVQTQNMGKSQKN